MFCCEVHTYYILMYIIPTVLYNTCTSQSIYHTCIMSLCRAYTLSVSCVYIVHVLLLIVVYACALTHSVCVNCICCYRVGDC